MDQANKDFRIITIKTNTHARTICVESLVQTQIFAKDLVKELRGGDVLALSGNLGSGKTTFTQSLVSTLGAKGPVTSPTFVLMKLYELPKLINGIKRVCHIDTYRLESKEDLLSIGAEEYIGSPDTLTIIEWPEKVKDLLPNDAFWISFELGDTLKK